MKNMFNVITVLPHNLLQTNLCIRNFSTRLQKVCGTTSLCGLWAALHFLASFGTLSLSRIPIKRNRMINIRAMRRSQFATLMTLRKPMWHHTKIKRLIQEIKNHICSVWTGSILYEPLCVYRETCCQEMGDETVFQHVLVSFFDDGVMKDKWTDDSVGWNCSPHINFCSIIFFLMQCVRKFPQPESNVLFIDNTIHMKVGFVCKPCVVKPLLPLPIMQTVASVPCLLPLVYSKRSFCMGKGEDLNEELFAVADERFLTQQKPSLLICWDFVSKPREPFQC